jgi:hypothetical protein
MSQQLSKSQVSPFDAIRQVDKAGREYWSARDLQKLLGYARWQKFEDAIERAMIACKNSNQDPGINFTRAGKPIISGKGRRQEAQDYHLTRYACYLTAMNGDPRKVEISQAQAYFAIKTREAETAQSTPQTKLHHFNEDYIKRLLINRERKVIGYWTIIEQLDALSLKYGVDLFKFNERSKIDISVGLLFMKHLKNTGFDTEGKVREIEHVVNLEVGFETGVKAYPNEWLGIFTNWCQTWYFPNHFPKYLKGKTPDGQPRISNPEQIPSILEKLVYDNKHLLH